MDSASNPNGDDRARRRPVGVVAEVVDRAAHPAYERWAEQVAHAGYCARPVRLRGGVDAVDTATGALRAVYSTEREPDGTVLKACGQRRETVCPACSAVYRADAWQLIAAGLRGGKGLPETVAGHPRLFLTLTAPSFGPVHSRRETAGAVQTCRPRRGTCPHGQPAGCFRRHRDGDRALGSPLCPECFDYPGAVVWNALAPALWARTTTYVRRALARSAGVDVASLARTVRVAYVKVAEFQARGLVHFHVVARLDGVPARGQPGPVPPPETFTAAVLDRAIRQAVATVTVPHPGGTGTVARWGRQVDIREITNTTDADAVGAEMVAAYIAKYATKSAATLGVLDRPLTGEDIDRLRTSEHVRMMVETCWTLGVHPDYRALRLRRWAHMLGFGGHWGTKSRAYSTTFRALREARAVWAAARRDEPADTDADEGPEPVEHWQTVGIGYRTAGDAWLAETAQRDHAEERSHARDAAKTAGGKSDHAHEASGTPPTNGRPENNKSFAPEYAEACYGNDTGDSAEDIAIPRGGDIE